MPFYLKYRGVAHGRTFCSTIQGQERVFYDVLKEWEDILNPDGLFNLHFPYTIPCSILVMFTPPLKIMV